MGAQNQKENFQSQNTDELIEYENFFLINKNNAYKFKVGKRISDTIIQCKNYIIQISKLNLSKLTKSNLDINEIYDYIINKFENNKVIIKDVITNDKIILNFKNQKKSEIILDYNKDIKEMKLNHYDDLKKDIDYLKKEVEYLKPPKPISQTNTNSFNNFKIENEIFGQKVYSSNIAYDSYSFLALDNTFCFFHSVNNIFCLVYSLKNNSIISYNLMNRSIITEIKNAHNDYITNYRYYFDNIKKRDLILSLSTNDNNIKIWNAFNWDCILNLRNVNTNGILYTACFLNTLDNITYIITSNFSSTGLKNKVKAFDFQGNKVKEIEKSDYNTYFLDKYYDKKTSKFFILTGNFGRVRSYDFDNNKFYKNYSDEDAIEEYSHYSIVMKENVDCVNMIESSFNGYVRIWNFHSGELIKKIRVCDKKLYSVIFWNDDYLFVGSEDKTIEIIDIKKGIAINGLKGHNKNVLTLKKINLPKYGECLLSQSFDNMIKFWNYKSNKII
jgi:WD40 repeat protein